MQNELVKQISYILYTSAEEDVKINVLVKDESIWLTQKAMAELFDCSADNISLHLKNIYEIGELEKNRTAEEISAVQKEGNRSVKRMTKPLENTKFLIEPKKSLLILIK